MALTQFVTISLLLIFSTKFCISQAEENYEECSTKKSVLLKALYNISDNQYELERGFAPPTPGETTPRYIKVIYSFADEDGNYGDCEVKYIWAIGGFFLIQPPHIFAYTSLLFSIPANKRDIVTVKLPYHCRGLIYEDYNMSIIDDACTCYNASDHRSEPLLVFTNQLNRYTKYMDSVNVVQDITSHAKSVCDENIENTKLIDSDEVRVFFSMVILVPIITMAVLVLIVRSTHERIHTRITRTSEKGYQNLVGFTLAGIIVMIFILFMDMAAVHYYTIDEHKDKHLNKSDSIYSTVNLFSPAVTLGLDLIITIPCLTFIIYLWSVQIQIPRLPQFIALTCLRRFMRSVQNKITKCIAPSYLTFVMPFFYVIFGSKTGSMLRDLRKQEKSAKVQKAINVWVMTGVAVAPFFCFSSHAGYILMAWVTDPVRTTAVFFIGIGCCLYLFFMFRQCYTVHAENTDGDESYILLHNATDPAKEYNPLRDVAQTDYGSVNTSNKGSRDVDDNAGCCNFACVVVFLLTPIFWFIAIFCVVSAQFFITGYVTVQFLVKVYRTCKQNNTSPEDFLDNLKPDHDKTKLTELSYNGILIAFGMSWLIVAPLVLILSSFFIIPVSTYILAQYLENMSQIVIVVLGLLISYKIFTRTESDIELFMRTFQDMARKNKRGAKGNGRVYRNKALQLSRQKPAATPGKQTQQDPQQHVIIPIEEEAGTAEITPSQLESSEEKYDNDMEAGGAIAGELTGKLINYLDMQPQQEDSEQEQDQQDQTHEEDQDEEREKERGEENGNSQAQDTIPEVEIHNT